MYCIKSHEISNNKKIKTPPDHSKLAIGGAEQLNQICQGGGFPPLQTWCSSSPPPNASMMWHSVSTCACCDEPGQLTCIRSTGACFSISSALCRCGGTSAATPCACLWLKTWNSFRKRAVSIWPPRPRYRIDTDQSVASASCQD